MLLKQDKTSLLKVLIWLSKQVKKITQTYRLNSLIFIVEKYRNKLLFDFLRQKSFASAGRGFFG